MAHSTELSVFNVTELTRLAAYKAAVAVGFYTDDILVPVPTYPFTARELSRLIVYKAAIAAAVYTDHPSGR